MKNPRIFVNQPLTSGSSVKLNDAAANHVGRVLRMKPGEPLALFNGEGGVWQGTIESLDRRTVTISLSNHLSEDNESPLSIHLGQCISRGERMDYAIQKSTELGISEITPLFSKRSEVYLKGERLQKRVSRWQQIVISACEQCGLNRVPVVHPPVFIEQWLASQRSELRLVLHHQTESTPETTKKPDSLSLLIGPEGGLEPEEIKYANSCGFHNWRLGPRVLRTETAPVVAIALAQHFWGDL